MNVVFNRQTVLPWFWELGKWLHQSSIGKLSSMERYCLQNTNNEGGKQIKLWTHKPHLITQGRATFSSISNILDIIDCYHNGKTMFQTARLRQSARYTFNDQVMWCKYLNILIPRRNRRQVSNFFSNLKISIGFSNRRQPSSEQVVLLFTDT